ncbi:hypothetical protein HY967_03860, partial [Candidatus Jorgensenbacteria bacterium]|nr:hypothetical protein [Candidatus Jorgensenbacteria bacterium]
MEKTAQKRTAIIFDFDGTLTIGSNRGKQLFIRSAEYWGATVNRKRMKQYWGINVLDLILKACRLN